MQPPVFRLIWTSLAAAVNLALAALLLWKTVHPSRLYGEPTPHDSVASAALVAVPILNLLALSITTNRNRGAQLFTRIVSWANRVGTVLGLLFGIGSCLELTFSTPEILITVVLVLPPAVTAIALWANESRPGVSSAT